MPAPRRFYPAVKNTACEACVYGRGHHMSGCPVAQQIALEAFDKIWKDIQAIGTSPDPGLDLDSPAGGEHTEQRS